MRTLYFWAVVSLLAIGSIGIAALSFWFIWVAEMSRGSGELDIFLVPYPMCRLFWTAALILACGLLSAWGFMMVSMLTPPTDRRRNG